MEKVKGYVSYDVEVKCPGCKQNIFLNQYPYINGGQYEDGEDRLGAAVFGFTDKPANWNPNIEFQCCRCKEKFILGSLEP